MNNKNKNRLIEWAEQMTEKKPSQVSQWFSEQLAGIFPDWFKSMFFGEPAVTEVRLVKSVQEIVRRKGQLVAPDTMLDPDGPEIRPVRRRIVDIWIPQSFFLRRVIEAPATARKNLRTMVELDMVRRTPFRPDAVFWAIAKPVKTAGSLQVEQWIAKRSDVDLLCKRAAKAGLHVRKVYIEGAPVNGPIVNFSANVTPNAGRWRLLNGALAATATATATMVFLYPAWQDSAENERLQSIIAENRSQAIEMRQEVETLRSREMERAAFLDIVYHRPRLSNVLRNLTVALPDNIWVTDLNFSPTRIIVSGEIEGSAAELVLALAKRNEFSNPRLSGPVARTGNGAERFELTLDLVVAQ
jgi:general secretion pathway protein L